MTEEQLMEASKTNEYGFLDIHQLAKLYRASNGNPRGDISESLVDFDPRQTLAPEDTNKKIVWSTKSVDVALDAIKKGHPLKHTPFKDKNINVRKADLVFQMTHLEREEFKKCKKSIIYFANTYCKLKNASTGIVDFIKLRDYQYRMLKAFQKNPENICLLSRQSGKTTTIGLFITWFICFHKDKNVAILGQKGKVGKEIIGKVKNIIGNLPFFLKPGMYTWNQTGIASDNMCMIFTSNVTIDAIQGNTIDLLFIDEFAYLPSNIEDEFWNNIYPTVSAVPNSKILLASTPNGKNLFYRIWVAAIKRKNTFNPIRVDYWEVPGRDEEWMKKEIANMGLAAFNQQYGLSFNSSTKSIISEETFKRVHEFIIDEYFFQPFDSEYEEYWRWDHSKDFVLEKDYFVITIDISEGLGDGHDFSTIKLFKISLNDFIQLKYSKEYIEANRHILEKHRKRKFDPVCGQIPFDKDIKAQFVCVGTLHGDVLSVPELVNAFVELGNQLNEDNFKVILERNTYGVEFMLNFDLEVNRDNVEFGEDVFIYYKKNEDIENTRTSLGLRLNRNNRKVGISSMQKMVNEGIIVDNDFETNEEMKSFGRDKNGRIQGLNSHDDLVLPLVTLSYTITNSADFSFFLEEILDENGIDFHEEDDGAIIDYGSIDRLANESKDDDGNFDMYDNFR